MADEDYLIDIDLDEVDDQIEPIPDGSLMVRVKSIIKKHKQGSEYPYFEVTMNPVDAPFQNRNIWLNLSMHPKALWNFKAFAKATGLPSKRPNIMDAKDKVLRIKTTIEPSKKNPDRKVNEVVGGDYQAVA